MSGYVVRPYRPGDETGILALFNDVFGQDDPSFEPRTLEAWRWEYDANPAGRQIMVAERDDGRIVAHYACLPVLAEVQGETVLAGQGVDSMVHPEYRRGLKKEGPFLAVARAYFETWGNARVCRFGFGFPNRRAYRIGLRRLGYEPVVERLPTLFRNLFETSDDDAVGRAFEGAAEVTEVERFGADVDPLWQRLRARHPFALVRDRRYLDWRYGDCPHVPYHCFEVRDGSGLRGWFVLRPGWQRLPILALVDLLAAPEDELVVALALRTAVGRARDRGLARVEAWLPEGDPRFHAALRHGFGTERCGYTLCVELYTGQPPLPWVRAHWYYTIGDSDIL